MKHFTLLLFISLLIGCATTTNDFVFDGSSSTSLERDVSSLMKRLKHKERILLTKALYEIQFSDESSLSSGNDKPAYFGDFNYEVLATKINGLNYSQVMELASHSPMKIITEK